MLSRRKIPVILFISIILPSCQAGPNASESPSQASSEPTFIEEVKMEFPTGYRERDCAPYLSFLNEAAALDHLPFSFVFAESGKGDLLYRGVIDSFTEENDRVASLPESVNESIEKTDYIKPIKDYLSAHLRADKAIPFSFSFEKIAFDPNVYSKEDFATLEGAIPKINENGGVFYADNPFYLGYLLEGSFLDINEFDAFDDDGTPVWAKEENESFYRELCDRFYPSAYPNVLYHEILYTDLEPKDVGRTTTLDEGESAALLPSTTIKGKTIKPVSLGYLTSISLLKDNSLSEKQILALCDFLRTSGMSKDDPMLRSGYGNGANDITLDEAEERIYLDIHRLGKTYPALYDFGSCFTHARKEEYNFCRDYAFFLARWI